MSAKKSLLSSLSNAKNNAGCCDVGTVAGADEDHIAPALPHEELNGQDE